MSGRREKGEGVVGYFSFRQDLAHVDGCIRVDSCAWWAQQKKAKAKTSRLRWIAVRDGNVGRTPLDDPKHCTP